MLTDDLKKYSIITAFAVWLLVPLAASVYGLINGFPSVDKMETGFPLRASIMVLFMYVPSLFVVAWFIVFAIGKFMTDRGLARIISVLFMTTVFIYSLFVYSFFDLLFWIVVSIFFLALGFAYYSIADLLYEKAGMDKIKRDIIIAIQQNSAGKQR